MDVKKGDDMPKISVIMGVFNCKNSKMLEDSVVSIINQTYKDWEFIICNDGSTNNTLDILKKLAKLDDRIKIISYEMNKGLAYALNYCLKHANGELIARQDDDDISLPERFERQVTFLNNHKEYNLVGTLAHIYDDNGIWGNYRLEEKPSKSSFLWNSPFIHPSIMMYKSDLLKLDGYRVAKETSRCEDYDLFMRMYAVGMKGYNIQEKLFKYRIVRNSDKKHRPMKYRIDEAIVRYQGFKKMGILVKGLPYIVKPLILGMIPQFFYKHIKKRTY